MKGPQLEGDMVADFSDIRKLHILTDKLRRLLHILKLNLTIGTQFKLGLSRIKRASSQALDPTFEAAQIKLDRFLLGQETSVKRLETLISRASGIGQLVSFPRVLERRIPDKYVQVQSIQDIRANEASKEINHEMRNLTEQSIEENRLVKRLTEQSTKDTRSMMAVALISAIFLPATFLAVSVTHTNIF